LAVAATVPLGSVAYEAQLDAQGQGLIWLARIIYKFAALPVPARANNDVILRLVEIEACRHPLRSLALALARGCARTAAPYAQPFARRS
jgi:hypothetical protein